MEWKVGAKAGLAYQKPQAKAGWSSPGKFMNHDASSRDDSVLSIICPPDDPDQDCGSPRDRAIMHAIIIIPAFSFISR